MRPARLLGIVAALLAILVIASAALIYLAVRSSWIEGVVARELADWLGEPVAVGSLRVGYLPVPWVEAQDVTIGPASAADEPLIRLAGARIEVPWRTVLRRDQRVERLVIDRLALHAAIHRDGRDNFSALIARLAGGEDAAPLAWSIGELSLEGGSLRYLDARDGTAILVSGVGLDGTEVAPGTTFEADLRLAVQWDETVLHLGLAGPATLDFDRRRYAFAPARWRGWVGGPQLELGGIDWTATVEHLSLDLAAGSLALRQLRAALPGVVITGDASVVGINETPTARFDLSSGPFSPRALAPRFGLALPATTDPGVFAEAQAAMRGTADAERVTIDSLDATLDDSTLTGAAQWPFTAAAPRLRLAIDRLDLDRYLPPAATPAPASPQDTLESLAGSLAELDLDAEVSIGEARVSGARMRNLRLVVEPNSSNPSSAR